VFATLVAPVPNPVVASRFAPASKARAFAIGSITGFLTTAWLLPTAPVGVGGPLNGFFVVIDGVGVRIGAAVGRAAASGAAVGRLRSGGGVEPPDKLALSATKFGSSSTTFPPV